MSTRRPSSFSPVRITVLATLSLLLAAASCSTTPFDDSAGDGGGAQDSGAGGGEGSVDPFRPSCPGEETTITGTVLAPNGKDPVPGASVFIPASVPELFPPDVKCEVCGTLGNSANLWFTTSKPDGTFTLDGVCPGQRFVVFQNGRFRRVIQIEVPPKQALAVPANLSRLPNKNAEQHPADAIPKIAVATGDYDKMECVLRKMGLADGSYDLYEGAAVLGGIGSYPEFKSLVGDLNKMKQYNIIFINCTRNTFEKELENPAIRQNIQQYVQSGGRLYVTDWSYDWIEQVETLAPFLDFEPEKSAATPEEVDKAALGEIGLQLQATIKQPQLAEWLALFPNTVSGDKAHIEHFLDGWVMIRPQADLHEDVKVWVEGDVYSAAASGHDIRGIRPLTVTFNFENCGKILFSSYHTAGRDDELQPFPMPKPFPQYCQPSFSPQDRILEYLIFDIANCVEPIK